MSFDPRSPEARAALAARRNTRHDDDSDGFEILVRWLEQQSWSEFAVSLAKQARDRGTLSRKQRAAAENMRDKCLAREKARQARDEAQEALPVYDALIAGFEASTVAGLKYPAVFYQGIKFYPATRFPGVIYLKRKGDYLGKINAEGHLVTQHEAVRKIVEGMGDNLEEAIRKEGYRTGACALCGRELTDPDSIQAGVGPICAKRWGWGPAAGGGRR